MADGEDNPGAATVKPVIGDFFYNDQSLGLDDNYGTEIDRAERAELAREVLSFMWHLCLDDAVFDGQRQNTSLPFESSVPRNNANRFSLDSGGPANHLEASLRPRKGLSTQSHQLCID